MGEAGYRPDGGCGFAVDPRLEAPCADVFWRPEIAPGVVIVLAPTPEPIRGGRTPELIPVAAHEAREGTYLRLHDGTQALLTGGAQLGDHLSVLLPLDAHFDTRIAAAASLGGRFRPAGGGAGLTRMKRRRYRQMLQASDGQAQGLSYRDVAAGVLGDTFGDSLSWRTSAARDVAIRLCRGAARLVREGYLGLLRRRR